MTLADFDPATFDRWMYFGHELLAWTGAHWERALYLRPGDAQRGTRPANAWVLLGSRDERAPKKIPLTQLHPICGPRVWVPSWDLDAPSDTDDPVALARRARQRGAR